MRCFGTSTPDQLTERRGAAVLGACLMSLALSMPPGLSDNTKDSPSQSPESSTAGATAAANQESAPTAKESSTPAPEDPPVDQGSSSPPQASAPSTTDAPAPGSASAEQSRAQDSSRSPEPRRLHRAQMRLSGSTCLACLMALERKLKAVPGVTKVKIERAGLTHFEFQGAPGITYSEATITYDLAQVALSEIVAFMKTQGYHAYKIVDKDKG